MRSLTSRHLKVPKYLQLAEQFHQQIESGVLKPDDRLPSYPQMRAQFGVTNSTVEKVYDLLERDGLIVRQPSRGTFVAHPAKTPVAPERNGTLQPVTSTVGVCGMGFNFAGNSSYWGRLLQGMREATQQRNAHLMLLDHNSLSGWEKADGVLLCDYVSEEVLQHLPPGLPRVFLITPLDGMCGVSADDYAGDRIAAEHLLQLGHQKIAYLCGRDPVLAPQRKAGYTDALKAAGISPQENWVRILQSSQRLDYGADFVNGGRETMQEWIRDEWKSLGCTAILAHNDEVAIGIIQALREAGISVPGDVSVVGFDGSEIGEYSNPPLTTVQLPLRRIGAAAAELLLQKVHNERENSRNHAEHRLLPVQLCVRESSAVPLRPKLTSN